MYLCMWHDLFSSVGAKIDSHSMLTCSLAVPVVYRRGEGCQSVPLLFVRGCQEELSFCCVTLSLTQSTTSSRSSSSNNPPSCLHPSLFSCSAWPPPALPCTHHPQLLQSVFAACDLWWALDRPCLLKDNTETCGWDVVVTRLWEWGQEQLWGGDVSVAWSSAQSFTDTHLTVPTP